MHILSIGEPLIEFTAQADDVSVFHRRVGGDTLNTAIYLSRLMGAGQVGYLSCLGDDPQSHWLLDAIRTEGIDIGAMQTAAGRRPGLYVVTTDAEGERSFTYWRDQAPVREMFDDPSGAGVAALDQADTLFLSAITLAVLRPKGRRTLLDALQQRQSQGAQVIFDTNYRPILWEDAATAADWIAQAARISSLVLPSQDDITACYAAADPQDAMECLKGMTKAEIVMTTGGADVLHRAAGGRDVQEHRLPPAVRARDTTGAGDSFNAAFIAARARGHDVADAVAAAARLAAVVVTYPGAIIPRSAMVDPFAA